MMLPCEETDELLAPFALDALDAVERQSVLEHLSQCRLHDEELESYREVAGLLPLAIEEAPHRPAARSALLRDFEEEIARATTPTVAVASAPGGATRLFERGPAARRGLPGLWRSASVAYGLAAALLLLVVGLAAWNLSLQADERDILARTTTANGMSLRVLVLKHEDLTVLQVEMPSLNDGRVYQAWRIVDGTPLSLGTMSGSGVVTVPAELARTSAFAISIEPPGGSPQPTTSPILVTEL